MRQIESAMKHLYDIAILLKQEALSSISSAGQQAYTEYSRFSGPPKGEKMHKVDKFLKIIN